MPPASAGPAVSKESQEKTQESDLDHYRSEQGEQGASWASLLARVRPKRDVESAAAAAPEDTLSAFSSESGRSASFRIPRMSTAIASASSSATSGEKEASQPPRRLSRGQAATAAVVLVAVVQGALMALWLPSTGGAAETGSVAITSEPAGAAVSIDGAAQGVTPVTVALSAGAHRIDVGGGAAARTRIVTVARGGESSVHLELAAEPPAPVVATTGLQISTDPTGANITVDGKARGTAPLLVKDLAPGSHVVTVSGSGGKVTQRVTVREATVSSLVISMTRTSEFASGWLAVSSPIPAQILEDNTMLGSTDAPRILIAAGRHDLELRNPALGYRARRTVQIAAGKTTSLTVEVPPGVLHINALPWAEVSLGNRPLGETPIANLSVPIGNHELVFRHPELGELRKMVVVGLDGPVRVGVDLRKGSQ